MFPYSNKMLEEDALAFVENNKSYFQSKNVILLIVARLYPFLFLVVLIVIYYSEHFRVSNFPEFGLFGVPNCVCTVSFQQNYDSSFLCTFLLLYK